jgi:dienelactone hydrolase
MKRIHKIIRVVWIAGGLLFSLWLIISFQAKGVDAAILESDSKVTVEEFSTSIRFTPVQNVQTAGLIFYPGGMVDPDAYAPMARALAEAGYTVIIIKLPFRTAPFAALEEKVFKQTQSFITENQGVDQWILGGHSRGAAIAVRFAHQFPDLLGGLVLMGTSHPQEAAFDLSTSTFPVMKIYATNDGLASVEEVQANAIYLPEDTIWVDIDGGNHAQFGYYGMQLGDGSAEISREEQQGQVLNAILQMFDRVVLNQD